MLSSGPSEPLRVVVLASRRAPGAAELAARGRSGRWQVAAGVSSHKDSELKNALGGFPVLVNDIAAFYAMRGSRIAERSLRCEYDRTTLELLAPYQPDLVVLSGYLYLVSEVLLEAFPGRIINIHDSDLLRIDHRGIPLYRGLHATRDAILAGEPETRSSVHIVTAELDCGPVLVRSEPFPVHRLVRDALRWRAVDILKAYAYAQREWMMRACWGKLLIEALDLLASRQAPQATVAAAVERYDPALALYGTGQSQGDVP
jgi:folate-dependent phosphoribosylglycinamide formyltransferase PurN